MSVTLEKQVPTDGGGVVRPDISIILEENYSIFQTHIFGAPDMVCEILPDTSQKKSEFHLVRRVLEYITK